MKITVTETKQVEINPVYPVYKKTPAHFVAILSAEEMIIITDAYGKSIEYREDVLPEWYMKQDSTEQEFVEAYEAMKSKIGNKLVNSSILKAA